MKKIFTTFLLFIMIFIGSISIKAQDYSEVERYATNLVDTAIVNIFNKNNKTWESKISPFRKVLMDNFDFDFISHFVLGQYGRGITDAQKKQFIKDFSELNIYTFARKFQSYSDQKIDVTDVKPGKKEGQYFVSSLVRSLNPGEKDFSIDWRLTKVGDKYQVIDVIVEGVSMAMSYKNEYAPILKQASDDGKVPVDVLNQRIVDKLAALKKSKEN